MFSPTNGMTREERRAYELEQKQIAFNEHLESVLDRAPDLTFFRSRTETEALGIKFLKSLYIQMTQRHLTDLQVETAQKAYEEFCANQFEYVGTQPAPEGITFVQGYVRDAFRMHSGILRHNEPNRASIMVIENRGFGVVTSCPQFIIEQAGSLSKIIGRRIQFGIDLVPSKKDHTLGYKRPKAEGGNSKLDNIKLLGNHFDDLE